MAPEWIQAEWLILNGKTESIRVNGNALSYLVNQIVMEIVFIRTAAQSDGNMPVKTLSASEMSELDRVLIEDYRIELGMMMENAGRALAIQSKAFLGGSLVNKRVLVLAGKGNNGGGGMVAARHMNDWGADVIVLLTGKPNGSEPARQLSILKKMQVRVEQKLDHISSDKFDLTIDSLLGYNQRGDPRPTVATLVRFANDSRLPIIALDIPTGLDPNSGVAHSPCIRATQTLTLALPKTCFTSEEGMKFAGDLYLADISVPRQLYAKYGIHSEKLFGSCPIVRLNYKKVSDNYYSLDNQESEN